MIAALDNIFMHLADFIADHFVNFASNTTKQYPGVYRRFCEWMTSKHRDSDHPSKVDAMQYIAHLKRKNLSDRTIKNYFIVLNRIFKAANEFGVTDHNPWPHVKSAISWRQVRDKRPTKYIQPKAVKKALEVQKDCSIDPVRDQAIIALAFGTGLRRSEICNLQIGDLMVTTKGTIFIEIKGPKGGKTRRHPIPAWAWPDFSALISRRKSEGAREHDYVFASRWNPNKPISDKTLYRIYKRYTGHAPHSARASFATQLLLQGYTTDQVAAALGHTTNQQVKVYQKRELAVDDQCGKNINYDED